MLNNNRGMFAEEIINRTILFYENNVDIYIEKREIPIKIVSKKDNGYIVGKLLRKSFVDYFGVYKNKHFEFEVKQTEKEYFDIALLKNHQISHLVDMEKRNIKTFIIVYSSIENKFYILKTS
jgi:recombination protein U